MADNEIHVYKSRFVFATELIFSNNPESKAKRTGLKLANLIANTAADLWTIDRHLIWTVISFYARPVSCNSQQVIW